MLINHVICIIYIGTYLHPYYSLSPTCYGAVIATANSVDLPLSLYTCALQSLHGLRPLDVEKLFSFVKQRFFYHYPLLLDSPFVRIYALLGNTKSLV
jgi:hypothetical protein